MERPLEDVRPLGPFAQSEGFNNTLLSGGSTVEISELFGEVVYLEIAGPEVREAESMMEDLVNGPLYDFLDMIKVGTVNGEKEGVNNLNDVVGLYFRIEDGEPEVTLGQIEQFVQQEISSQLPVDEVNIYRS